MVAPLAPDDAAARRLDLADGAMCEADAPEAARTSRTDPLRHPRCRFRVRRDARATCFEPHVLDLGSTSRAPLRRTSRRESSSTAENHPPRSRATVIEKAAEPTTLRRGPGISERQRDRRLPSDQPLRRRGWSDSRRHDAASPAQIRRSRRRSASPPGRAAPARPRSRWRTPRAGRAERDDLGDQVAAQRLVQPVPDQVAHPGQQRRRER